MTGRTVHDELVESYFRGVARQHASGYDLASRPGYVYVRRRQIVASWLDEIDAGTVLDLGCGTGAMQQVAADRGFSYVGIDASVEMIAEACRTHPGDRTAFSVGRVEQVARPDASADVVLALGILEYVRPDLLSQTAAEIARLTRPGGSVVVSVLSRTAPVLALRAARSRLRGLRSRATGHGARVDAPETLFTDRRIRALLGDAGLDVARSTAYAFVLVPARVYDRDPIGWAERSTRLERLAATPLAPLGLGRLVLATRPPR